MDIKRAVLIISAIIFTLALIGCGRSDKPTFEEKNNMLAGITEDEIVDDALTIILCGSNTYDVEVAVSEFEKTYGLDVNVVSYGEGEWDKFAAKAMSQDSDFDLFMPVPAYIASIVRSGVYQELNDYSDIKARLESNSLTKMISLLDNTLIGVPCATQLSYTGNVDAAMTVFKYCYKNINLFTGEYSDEEGEEFFEVLKNRYSNPDDSRENAYYDFDYHSVAAQYVFMNRYSEKKELAEDFMCLLFDILNKDVDSQANLTYPEIESDAEYTPDWLFYSSDYIDPLGDAISAALDTDGSDEALRRLAEKAANDVSMRMEG